MWARLEDGIRVIRMIDLNRVDRLFRIYLAGRAPLPSAGWHGMLLTTFIRCDARCVYCGTEEGPFHLDHVTPIARGGPHTQRNFALACRRCNSRKTYKTAEEFGRPDLHLFEPTESLEDYERAKRARARKRPTVRHRHHGRRW